MATSTKIRKQAKQLKGRPVCITLHDGRSYVGWISGLGKDGLLLSSPRPRKNSRSKRKTNSRQARAQKASVSAFMPLLGLLGGGAGAAGGAAGAGAAAGAASGFGGLGFFGMIQKAMPLMQMGYNMIKTIRPFIGGLKGLMG